MPAFFSTYQGLRSLRRILRGEWRNLVSYTLPSLLCAVCFFVTLNGVPVGMLLQSQAEAEEATGEPYGEELGASVELFGRPRRCQSLDIVAPHSSALPGVLPGTRPCTDHRVRDGHRPSLPLALNGCGAILRC